jgi:hypothetical protein
MALIPKGKKIETFKLPIDGTFGRFKTTESYEVNYLLSSMPLGEAVTILSTAADAFPFAQISFEEMIQRDIDTKRVQKEIVEDYLEGARDKVVFFPPLIVAVVSKENGKPLQVYDSVDFGFEGDPDGEGIFSMVYGKDKFVTFLNTAADDTGRHIVIKQEMVAGTGLAAGKRLSYVPYAATMRINIRHVQLVVIDGQHRFEAMKILLRDRKDLVECMDVPVCIVYTPGAVSSASSESIVRNLREMFVTINTTSRSVSGHFIDLLKDHSLASIAVRSLAGRWKGDNANPCRSRLQMLEWNERADNKATQVNRDYTITSVSILADALRHWLFEDWRNGVPQSLLNLKSVKTELEVDADSTKYAMISDEDFAISQEPVLKRQISNLITPALDVLFTMPRPYKEQWELFLQSVTELDDQRELTGVQAFRDNILGKFRTSSAKDSPEAKDAEKQFQAKFEQEKPYFFNVFQQGLVRTWITCAQALWDHAAITPANTAICLIEALDKFCFLRGRSLFDASNPYATRVLYQGAKPNTNQWGKAAWANVVSATLLQKASWKEFTSRIAKIGVSQKDTDIEGALEKVRAKLTGAAKLLAEEVNDRIGRDIKTNWRTKDYPKAFRDDLERLAASSVDSDQTKFIEKLNLLTEAAFKEANTKFEAMFGFELA